jgi:transposase-like protein
VKYLNNVIEADHGKLKQLIRPVRGFKTLCACAKRVQSIKRGVPKTTEKGACADSMATSG